jgi:two-component system cell cycle sensor histidine kinase/response regulator CckA
MPGTGPAATKQPLRVLIVDDSARDAELSVNEVTRGGYDVTSERVQTAETMKEALAHATWDIVLSDYSMPAFSGPAALDVLQASGCDLPFIIISGTIGEETAVSALKAGANDYLLKGRLTRLVPAIERELRDVAARQARVLLEEKLRQSQKLEAIGQLAGGVAHDFNNLITAILGYSNFVIETLEDQDPRRADLEEVVRAGQRAAALTRQLLAFSRKQVLKPVPVNINALVTGMHQMLGRLIGEHIDLVTVLAPDLNVVLADPGQLEQVLMNLLVNARDAMPSGGRVAVETANVELDDLYTMQHASVRPGSFVMLAVSDRGVGMSKETQRHLFEPFFTTKDAGKGTGLGLATVHGIVQQSNGHIWVYSELGSGTTFKVYLPRSRSADKADERVEDDQAKAIGTETVLIVEDEAAVRFLTRLILEKAGYRVFEAADPQQAEDLFERNVDLFDLVVSDVVMPGLSGPLLFERFARRRPDLKVLFMSGYTDAGISSQGLMEPGVEYLQKPFTAGALQRRVRDVLDRS